MIEYSVEHLYHFLCHYCNKWFSIGDWAKVPELTCPLCGVKSSVEVRNHERGV